MRVICKYSSVVFFVSRLWEEGWRDRYYLYKFGVSKDLCGQQAYEEFRKQVVCETLFLKDISILITKSKP